jgi:hypothetical protein
MNRPQFEKKETKDKIITFQTSSVGKLEKGFLTATYNFLTGRSVSPKDICERYNVIFPTEDYVVASHCGVEMANSVIL